MTAVYLRKPSLYVGDLHPDTTEHDLEQAFSSVGPLDSVRLCKHSLSGKSLCYAFVSFLCVSHASQALACLNHTNLREKPMRIMWRQMNPLILKSGIGNVFVKNLAPSVTSAQLEQLFSEYGTILSCKVAEENGNSKCHGFVQFGTQHSAIAAISSLHGTMFEGKKLYVSAFKKKEERMVGQGPRLYVGNLNVSVNERILQELFCVYGEVVSVKIIRRDGISKGFGFVSFSRTGEAKAAMNSLHRTICDGKPLSVAWAHFREEHSRKPLNSYVPNRPQPFFTHKSLCHIPPYSLPVPIQHFNHYHQSSVYQNFGRQISTLYPAGSCFTYEFKKQIWQLPMKCAPSGSLPAQKWGTQNQPRTFCEPKNKNMNGCRKLEDKLA